MCIIVRLTAVSECTLIETQHLPSRSGSRIIHLQSSDYASDKRYQLFDRLEVGRLHRREVFDTPPDIPMLYVRVPA